MTPREIEYVRVTFAAVAPQAAAVAQLFYDRLFELDPRLRPLFKGDLDEQGVKLMRTIGLAVAALGRVDTLVPTLREMGGGTPATAFSSATTTRSLSRYSGRSSRGSAKRSPARSAKPGLPPMGCWPER